MCSGRVDLEFILRAFSNGLDGVFIGGCRLDECNYITHGNYDALSNTYMCKKIMEHIGINPERLRIKFMSGADGILLAEATDDFVKKIKKLGPLGTSEKLDRNVLESGIKAATRLIPYIKLVERERLRVPVRSEEAYHKFFAGDEFKRLFSELVLDKLSISKIMLLLGERPLSTADISGMLGLSPSEVSRHMKNSSVHGLVRYDVNQKCYALA